MADRMWQMTRLGKGDYLLPSNDRSTLYRLRSYTEDGSATYGSTKRKVLGTRWQVLRWNRAFTEDNLRHLPDDIEFGDGGWFWAPVSTVRTRKQAIEAALEHG